MQMGEDIYGEYLVEPTQEENEMISLATTYANDVSRYYGANRAFSADRIFLVAPESLKKALNDDVTGGVCNALNNSIGVERKESEALLALTVAHEIFHMNSYHSAQVHIDEETAEPLNKPYRSGIRMRGRKDGRQYFYCAEEAIASILAKRLLTEKLAHDPRYAEEIARSKKIKAWVINYANESDSDEETRIKQTNAIAQILLLPNNEPVYQILFNSDEDDDYKFNYFFGYYEEVFEKGDVFHERDVERERFDSVLDRILTQSDDPTLNKETLFDMFARAHFTGNYLPLARTLERILGKGSFRKIAEELEIPQEYIS
jgi:hypothetical protein